MPSWAEVKIRRPDVPASEVERAISRMTERLVDRVEKHGPGAYAGPHETLGILDEEFDELRDAVRSNVDEDVAKELLDIAVGCIFGIASLRTVGRIP